MKPILGGEKILKMSPGRARYLGDITVTAAKVAVGGGIAKLARVTSTGVVTVTTSSAHGLAVGQMVDIDATGTHSTAFDLQRAVVTAVGTPTTFTYVLAGADLAEEVAAGSVKACTVTWTADAVNTPLATGDDLVLAVNSPTGVYGGEDNVWVVLHGTNVSAAAITAVGAFSPPGYSRTVAKVFPYGYAVDAVASGENTFKTITGATAYCAAEAVNAKFKVMALPALTTFAELGCETNFEFSPGTPESVSIACRMDGTAFSKPGQSPEKTATIGTRLFGMGEGLMRYNGTYCTAMLEIKREGVHITDRVYLTDLFPMGSPTIGEGNDPASVSTTGKYEHALLMPAPTA